MLVSSFVSITSTHASSDLSSLVPSCIILFPSTDIDIVASIHATRYPQTTYTRSYHCSFNAPLNRSRCISMYQYSSLCSQAPSLFQPPTRRPLTSRSAYTTDGLAHSSTTIVMVNTWDHARNLNTVSAIAAHSPPLPTTLESTLALAQLRSRTSFFTQMTTAKPRLTPRNQTTSSLREGMVARTVAILLEVLAAFRFLESLLTALIIAHNFWYFFIFRYVIWFLHLCWASFSIASIVALVH